MVVDATAQTFEEAVIERSHQIPVLVDFWAPWCGPCRMLGPVLEQVAEHMSGAFELVKVNSEENPELSARHGVRGIPDVRLFKDGREVDRFVGAKPADDVRAFLRPHCPTDADRHLEAARNSADPAAARQALEAALAADPGLHEARLQIAQLALADGDPNTARDHLRAVPASHEAYDRAEALLAGLQLAGEARDAGNIEALTERLDIDPADLEARFALGGHAVGRGDHRGALELYLDVARRDKQWKQQAARKAMVTVFQIVGVREPLSDEYRDRLKNLYY